MLAIIWPKIKSTETNADFLLLLYKVIFICHHMKSDRMKGLIFNLIEIPKYVNIKLFANYLSCSAYLIISLNSYFKPSIISLLIYIYIKNSGFKIKVMMIIYHFLVRLNMI